MRNNTFLKKPCSAFTNRIVSALIILALVFTAHTSVYAAESREIAHPDDIPVIGIDISSMNTTDINGNTVTGSVFSQKSLTVLHFFATWSPDCIHELPYMQTALNTFGSNTIAVYGLLLEDGTSTPAACAELFDQLGLSYGCLRLDPVLNALVSNYPYIPQTFLINSQGVVAAHFPGTFNSFEQLETMIARQLNGTNLPGDVDMDGAITTSDALITLRHAIGTALHPGVENYGDVDGDGNIGVTDAMLIMRHALGISTI